MRKTNKNLKRIKTVKTLVVFACVQLFIVSFFLITFFQRQQATMENTEKIIFVADKVEFVELPKHRKIIIYSDSVKYTFNLLIDQEYQGQDLIESLSYEELTIIYKKVFNLWGDFNAIVDIRSEKTVYYTMEAYNQEQSIQLTMAIIILSILECVFLCILTFYLIFSISEGILFNFNNTKNKNR